MCHSKKIFVISALRTQLHGEKLQKSEAERGNYNRLLTERARHRWRTRAAMARPARGFWSWRVSKSREVFFSQIPKKAEIFSR